jgi:hypothetical protein
MRAGIVVDVTRADRRRLEAIIADRSAPQKHVWRASIILATADGCGTTEIMRRSGKSKPVVWRWQARFTAEGVEGLTRDKTRKPGKQPLPTGTIQTVVNLTLGAPPGDATHWTGRMLAKVARVSLRSVQRILEAHQLAPHRIRTFKLSAASPLDVPLHPDLSILAQRGRRLLRQAHAPARLKRGVFRSVVDLQVAINRFVADTNANPKPFVWTADPKRVLAAVKRGKQTLESVH